MKNFSAIVFGLVITTAFTARPLLADDAASKPNAETLGSYIKQADNRETLEDTGFKNLDEVRLMRMSYDALIADVNARIKKKKPPSWMDADDQTPDDPGLVAWRKEFAQLRKPFADLEETLLKAQKKKAKKEKKEAPSFDEKGTARNFQTLVHNWRDTHPLLEGPKSLAPQILEDRDEKKVYQLPATPPKEDSGQKPAGAAEPQ